MVILRLKNPCMCNREGNKNVKRGKKEKIIVYCGFKIFILPETRIINVVIPQDFLCSLYEKTKSFQV